MTPYYEQDGITIYHGDCRDVLPRITSCRRVGITDPPYNVGIVYGDDTNDQRADYQAWCSEWFTSLRCVTETVALTPGIVNVGMWYRIAEPKWIIAWLKPAAMGRSPFGFCNWEPVLVYGQPRTRGSVDVMTACIVPDDSLDDHPCPKPIKWAAGLIHRLAAPTDAVIDPFSGTGTTLIAAKSMGHHAIGIEIEERYCEIAAKRLSQGVLSLTPVEPLPTQAELLA